MTMVMAMMVMMTMVHMVMMTMVYGAACLRHPMYR